MNRLQRLLTAGVLAIGLQGCPPKSYPLSPENHPLDVLVGEPLSVKISGDWERNNISIVVADNTGKKILASVSGYSSRHLDTITNVAALTEAEINDGDCDKIKLKGYFVHSAYMDLREVEVGGFVIPIRN